MLACRGKHLARVNERHRLVRPRARPLYLTPAISACNVTGNGLMIL